MNAIEARLISKENNPNLEIATRNAIAYIKALIHDAAKNGSVHISINRSQLHPAVIDILGNEGYIIHNDHISW